MSNQSYLLFHFLRYFRNSKIHLLQFATLFGYGSEASWLLVGPPCCHSALSPRLDKTRQLLSAQKTRLQRADTRAVSSTELLVSPSSTAGCAACSPMSHLFFFSVGLSSQWCRMSCRSCLISALYTFSPSCTQHSHSSAPPAFCLTDTLLDLRHSKPWV